MSPTFPPVDQSQSPSLACSDKTNELAKWTDGEPSVNISISPLKTKILTTDAEYELELCSAKSLSQLQRPMAVYRQALVDYYLADAKQGGHSDKKAQLRNVRFLRDTAENILHIAENEGLKNSGLYRQVQQVFQSSRNHALYLSEDRRRQTNQVKSDSSGGNHGLRISHNQSFGDRGIHFASSKRGRSHSEERSYHDSVVHDDRQHGQIAFDSRPDREYGSRYHGTRRFLRREMDTMTATRDALDDSNIFDDHDTIAAQGAYHDRSSYYVQVYPRQDTESNRRSGRGLLDSWRPPT
ncbi:uncharacterized protein N7503_005625 [Penicillium pulvis]|uniref:uncharacterized protein n=1 Tax=Penicillium pulvis TaxID=1562058 RepID=UPI002547E5B6|nr:uncharacterized protein N7503_005625 [Penicillium pulvis]KAJ5803175.1 hypothetical protein N7503_005625 [Penicillium pulvis]